MQRHFWGHTERCSAQPGVASVSLGPTGDLSTPGTPQAVPRPLWQPAASRLPWLSGAVIYEAAPWKRSEPRA